MERETYYMNGVACYDANGETRIGRIANRLAAYEDAEEQGRLVILPKTLYEADSTPVVRGIIEWTVTGVCYYDGAVQSYMVRTETTISLISGQEIGKTVFLTPEEAAAALKKGEQ